MGYNGDKYFNYPDPVQGFVADQAERPDLVACNALTSPRPDVPYRNDRKSNPPLKGLILVISAFL